MQSELILCSATHVVKEFGPTCEGILILMFPPIGTGLPMKS